MTLDINIHVVPGSKKESLEILPDGTFKIKIREKPVDNSANLGLIDFISEHFAIKRSKVELIRGHKSRHKVLKISFNNENEKSDFQNKILKYERRDQT